MYKKVVVLGGGTGISYLLKGLKDFPVDITAVIAIPAMKLLILLLLLFLLLFYFYYLSIFVLFW